MNSFHLNTSPKIKSGFKVPEGYFESFESKLFEELQLEKEPKVISLLSRKAKWYWMAAAAIIFAVSLPIHNYFNNASLGKPTASELEYYFNVHPAFTTEDIISQLNETEIQTLKIDSELKTENIENYLLKTESIEYYLLD